MDWITVFSGAPCERMELTWYLLKCLTARDCLTCLLVLREESDVGWLSMWVVGTLLGCLAVCAWTDIRTRHVSETLVIGIAALMVVEACLQEPWWWVGACAVSAAFCAGAWWVADRKDTALGDVEMAGLVGLGLGPGALVALFVAAIAALATRPLWPKLCGPYLTEEERRLAPMGLYFFIGVVVAVVCVPWMLAFLLRR